MATNAVSAKPLNIVPPNVGGSLQGDQYLHPTLAAFKDDPLVSSLQSVFQAYRSGLEAVKKSILAHDPTRTEQGQFVDNHRLASKRLSECGERGEAASKVARIELERIEGQITQALDIREGPYSAELRADFRAQDANKRLADAMKAIDAGDTATLAAILAAPARLSGLSDADQAMIRARHADKHAPDLVARRGAIAMALATNDRANMDAIAANIALFPPANVAEIKSRMAEAQEARAAI